MNRGPTVAQSLPVDRYAGNCLIKPSYYCGGGGGVHNVPLEPLQRCRYDAVQVGASSTYRGHGAPYQHYQQLQDWYGRAAYWHHHHQNGVVGVGVSGGGVGVGGGSGSGPLAEKANFAAHKHGAPLIQAAKYNRTGSGGPGGPGKKYSKKTPTEQPNCNGKKNDGGSDESSGAASENSLPRIIKPRKRRKKERKPVPGIVLQPQAAAPSSVGADRPQSPSSSVVSSAPSSPPPPPVPPSVSDLVLVDAAVPFDTIRLSADIKAVSLEDVSTCQCACCDPVGNVWDVGRRCFSPSLTRPEPPARRSWSGEPSPPPPSSQYFKIVAAAATAVDYAKTETAAPAARARTHSLEVSSEIVTSHNGHRDIEIKFFTMPIGHR